MPFEHVVDTRCGRCKYYITLKDPFHYKQKEYPDGVTVYGFCTKDVARNFGFYPVYLPDGGQCKSFKKAKVSKCSMEKPMEGQIQMWFVEEANDCE